LLVAGKILVEPLQTSLNPQLKSHQKGNPWLLATQHGTST